MSRRFINKVAFVTGAASGIGRATAVAFATEGARLTILDLTEDDLRDVDPEFRTLRNLNTPEDYEKALGDR